MRRRRRHALGMGLALALGFAALPLGCESWDAPAMLNTYPEPRVPPRAPELPASVVQQLTSCAEQVTERGEPSKPLVHAMQFRLEAAPDGQVGAVGLEGATISDGALEACIAGALRKMRVPVADLPLRVASEKPKVALGAEARALSAFPLASLVMASFSPAVLVVTGLMLTVVVVVYLVNRPHQTSVTLGPTGVSMPTPVAEPTATGAPTEAPVPVPTVVPVPTATSVPTAAPVPVPKKRKKRRNPNQTCEDDDLDALETVKFTLCNSGYAADCSGNRDKSPTVATRMDTTPCSAIQRSIVQRMLCLKQRNLIQKECYGGVPDAGHAEQIRNTERGIGSCVALEAINCAAGHPMSQL